MRFTALTWEQTLSALLTFVDTDVWATTYVDGAPVSAFTEHLRCVEVRPAPYTGVEQARLDFGILCGLVFLRRDEHLATRHFEDGTLRVKMLAWELELETRSAVESQARSFVTPDVDRSSWQRHAT